MNKKDTLLEISEIETLLEGFSWLKHPPEPVLPQINPELLSQAVDQAWKSELNHKKKTLEASRNGR